MDKFLKDTVIEIYGVSHIEKMDITLTDKS